MIGRLDPSTRHRIKSSALVGRLNFLSTFFARCSSRLAAPTRANCSTCRSRSACIWSPVFFNRGLFELRTLPQPAQLADDERLSLQVAYRISRKVRCRRGSRRCHMADDGLPGAPARLFGRSNLESAYFGSCRLGVISWIVLVFLDKGNDPRSHTK